MIILSPWSKGGGVNSQVFDHTSLIRFLEHRFGVLEPNITPAARLPAT
jgi:phospholipase C